MRSILIPYLVLIATSKIELRIPHIAWAHEAGEVRSIRWTRVRVILRAWVEQIAQQEQE